MAISLSFSSSYQRLCHLIGKISISLLFFKFLETYCFTKVVRMTLYASVHWLWGGVRCKILGSINKADNLRIILSVWACLAFHKLATYTQTTSYTQTFDTDSVYRTHPILCSSILLWGFPRGSGGKESPAMQETWVQSLSWEHPLVEGIATHSSILAWRIPWTEDPRGLQSMGLQRGGHDWSDWAWARKDNSQ